MKRNKINLISNLLIVISFLFIINKIIKMDINLCKVMDLQSLYKLMPVLIVLIFNNFILSHGWIRIVESYSLSKIDRRLAINIFLKTNLGKYIPGNIMQFVGRNMLGAQLKITQVEITISYILETICLVFSAFTITSYYILSNLEKFVFKISFHTFIIITIVLIFLLLVVTIGKTVSQKFSSLVEEINKVNLKKTLIKYCLCYVPFFLLMGISFFIVIATFNEVDNTALLFYKIISSFILSWFIGLITPGVPGGIGVRESILILLLGSIIRNDLLIISVILHRLISIIADICSYLIYALVYNNYRKGETKRHEYTTSRELL